LVLFEKQLLSLAAQAAVKIFDFKAALSSWFFKGHKKMLKSSWFFKKYKKEIRSLFLFQKKRYNAHKKNAFQAW